jgi:hypothetical protein
LPFGLMSELPLAMVFAKIILRIPQDHIEVKNPNLPGYEFAFPSEVHKCRIVCYRFEKWLNEKVQEELGSKKPEELFPRQVIEGARCILYSYLSAVEDCKKTLSRLIVDCEGNEDSEEVLKAKKRLKEAEDFLKYGRINTIKGKTGVNHLRCFVNEANQSDLQVYFWNGYLAMMNHGQRIERGVKDAATVGKTYRGEQHRSATAVIRSKLIHNDELTNKSAPELALAFVEAASELYQEHEELKKDEGYNDWIEEIIKYLKGKDHFLTQEQMNKCRHCKTMVRFFGQS